MMSYETWLRIKLLSEKEGLSDRQIAAIIDMDRGTVAKWLAREHYQPRKSTARPSKLDPFKSYIIRKLERHPYSAQQIYQMILPLGFTGKYTIVKTYVAAVRPRPLPAYAKLHFDPGDAAQMDWGECGTIDVEGTKVKLYVFVMVLCHSRYAYYRFYLGASMEHFLDGFIRSFEHFRGAPRRVMIDNLKTGVKSHPLGEEAQFNPRFLELMRHYGCAPVACNIRAGNEKGRVERGVGYIKGNFLKGYDRIDFARLQSDATHWQDTIANQRQHGSTGKIPIEALEQEEKAYLKPLNPIAYDGGVIQTIRHTKDCRIQFKTNTYSIPPLKRRGPLTLTAYPEKLRIHQGKWLISEHTRSYTRRKDISDPVHEKEVLDRRAKAREQNLNHRFDQLGSTAITYRKGLQKRANPRGEIRKILSLVEIHGKDHVLRIMRDAMESDAYGSEYIESLLQGYQSGVQTPGHPLHVPRAEDQLTIDAPDINLEIYNHFDESDPEKTEREEA